MIPTFEDSMFRQPIMPNNNYQAGPDPQMMPVQQYGIQQTIPAPQPSTEVVYDTGDSGSLGFSFTVYEDEHERDKHAMDTGIGNAPVSTKKKSSNRRKNTEVATVGNNEIIRAEGEAIDNPAIYSYYETNNMLNTTVQQIDMIAAEVKQELDNVRSSRTYKNKHNVMIGLAGNLSSLLETKISAIREMNNCTTKANDLDYKREKDRRTIEQAGNDDKTIMDLYQAFVQNPMAQNQMMTGANQIAATVSGGEIIRAASDSVNHMDTAYMNYMANLTPEQNMMLYEQNPDIKQVVVFDAATGNKWFQVMNTKTGQVIPNAPVHDQMFMEDTTLDLRNKIAKNINLNEIYPLVVINDNITNEY